MTIIHKSIRIIDYEAQQVTPRETPETFDTYVAELINHISGNTSVREYKTHSNATEVIGCILGICAKQNNQTTTSNFPCNFNFTVSNMNRFNQGIDHG